MTSASVSFERGKYAESWLIRKVGHEMANSIFRVTFRRMTEPVTIFTRRADVSTTAVNAEKRTIQVSFSSEVPYKRSPPFGDEWIEVLGHADGEVNLDRLNSGATVHYNHSRRREDRIGVVEKAWIDGSRGHAVIRFSDRPDIDDIWSDIENGLLRNISVGYRVHAREIVQTDSDGIATYRVTNWEALELSVVDIPADPTVGVGRAEVSLLPSGTCPSLSATPTEPVLPNFLLQGEKKMNGSVRTARDELRHQEQTRREEIDVAFQFAPDSDSIRTLRERCLFDIDCTPDQARKLLLEEIGKGKTASGIGWYGSSDRRRPFNCRRSNFTGQ